jgi:hypothetical protein
MGSIGLGLTVTAAARRIRAEEACKFFGDDLRGRRRVPELPGERGDQTRAA